MIDKILASPTGERGFGTLFGEAKSKLDSLQQKLASVIPSMPGMPVAKYLDLAIGIDLHAATLPPWPVCPVPHIGIVFDITATIMNAISSVLPDSKEGIGAIACNLIKGMAPSVKVHGRWIAQAGIPIVHLPGIFLHLPFPIVAPFAESEMWMGSSTVLADGGPCSTQFHPALSCNSFGFPPPPPRHPGKFKAPRKSLMMPTSLLSIITSSGKPVLVGGPPTIDLFQMAMKLGLKGLCQTKLFQKIQSKLDDIISNTPLGKIKQKMNCFLFGEPVDAATGRVYHTNTDFELPGPIPLMWSRTYYSDAQANGPLGYNWHHSYNISIKNLNGEVFVYRHPDGRESGLPVLEVNESYFDRKEQLLWSRDERGYVLRDTSKLYHRFCDFENRWGYCPVSQISTADGLSITFLYNHRGDLREIIDSCGREITVGNDTEGRVTCVYTHLENKRLDLIRYRYDETGNMIETLDANDVKKIFEYKKHLLVKLTNQSGMSFHWEYEGKGNAAKCIHTWGDGGIQENFIEYLPGCTRTRNGEGAITEYYYKTDKLIYKIVDANGGVTRQFYNEYEELIQVVDAEGFVQRSKYDEWGNLVRQSDRNSEQLLLNYDGKQNLIQAKTPGGKVLKWEYDEYDRLVKRSFPSGEILKYTYDGRKLQSITNRQKQRFDFAFNDHWELERLTYPNGISRKWEYDELGRMTKSVDVKGNATNYGYDRMNRVSRLDEPDGNTHHFHYDDSGNLTRATDNLREVEFSYGPMGTLTRRKQGNRTVLFGYNSELQLTRIRNEKGAMYDFELDGLGQVVGEYGFDNIARRYDRDGLGRVRRVSRPCDRWTEFIYDGIGNVIKETQHGDKVTFYSYDKDSQLIKAHTGDHKVEFKRDKAGRITEEKQDSYTITHRFDEDGNRVQTISSLGADIQCVHNNDGYLTDMSTGKDKDWQASWERDETGLEVKRTINSGLEIRTWRDNFGRETRKNIAGKGGVAQGSYTYQWGMGNRLLQKSNDLTNLVTSFTYNEFDDLESALYRQGSEVETIYRIPDSIGALYKQADRRDCKYDKGGRLLEDTDHHFHYDTEGNLIFKEYKQLQEEGLIVTDKKKRAKELGLEFQGSGTGCQYDWYSSGMLQKVTCIDGAEVYFTYDALGRRTAKIYNGELTRWVWNGNTPLHECTTEFNNIGDLQKPMLAQDENLITWVFESGTFIPIAKITKDDKYTIVTDYLGTPVQMYNSRGEKTWDCELDIYGKVRTFEGSSLCECPFRYQGQYEDQETGLYYNRFRFYDPNSGNYLSQDPIGLAGNNPTLYGYVSDINIWIDPFGLVPLGTEGFSVYALYETGSTKPYYIGITNQDIDTRMGQHMKSGRYGDNTTHEVLQNNVTIEKARGYEQAYMEHYKTKTGKIGSELSELDADDFAGRGNKINSFDKSRTDPRGEAFNDEYEKAKNKLNGKH